MITASIKGKGTQAILYVDATGFHQYLETVLGVEKGPTHFRDMPGGPAPLAYSASRINPELLLRLGGPHEVDLEPFITTPQRREFFIRLRDSITDVAREIVEHYTPIDIKVHIIGK